MSNTLADDISREVRAEMARQRCTQRELAGVLGISQGQTSARLRGDVEFRLSELERVAAHLRVPVAQFLPAPAPAERVSAA